MRARHLGMHIIPSRLPPIHKRARAQPAHTNAPTHMYIHAHINELPCAGLLGARSCGVYLGRIYAKERKRRRSIQHALFLPLLSSSFYSLARPRTACVQRAQRESQSATGSRRTRSVTGALRGYTIHTLHYPPVEN